MKCKSTYGVKCYRKGKKQVIKIMAYDAKDAIKRVSKMLKDEKND